MTQNVYFRTTNFVYLVEIEWPPHGSQVSSIPQSQPGVVAIPQDTRQVIMRLSNADAGLNNINRVQNEVAAMALAREALKQRERKIIPGVYGWANTADCQGWIMMQHMVGVPLDLAIQEMGFNERKRVLKEVAQIVFDLQQFELPPSIKHFGGLDFDSQGNFISAPLTKFHGGPFVTYVDMIKGIFREQLATADKSPIIDGWQSNGTRTKLENFVLKDIERLLKTVNTRSKRLIHGDFTMNNILVDGEEFCITAVLDFDWAQIGLVGDEILTSFHKRYARLPGSRDPDASRIALRKALLHGFPSCLPSPTRCVQWDIAAIWDSQLGDIGAHKPSTLADIEVFSYLHAISDLICPDSLCNEVITKIRSQQGMEEEKGQVEKTLNEYLISLWE